MGARLAWALAGLTAVLVVADGVITAQYRSLLSEAAIAIHGFPLVSGSVLGSTVMGALVIARDRRHVIGWLLVGLGSAGALSMVLEAYAVWVLDNDGPGASAAAGIAGWVSSLLGGTLALTAMVFLFLLVPDGRFPSPRWRIAGVVAVAGEVLIILGQATVDPLTFDLTGSRAGGGAAPRLLLSTLGLLAIASGLLAALVSMVLRLRRSSGVRRQQLRVVALSAATLFGGVAWLLVAEWLTEGPQRWVTILPLFIAYLLLPILLAIAVLRYRLYDVDVIVNRTLVLTLGTAFAGLGYVTLVVVVGKVVDSRTSGYWYSLIATALVAVAFQPLRRTVVAVANRMVFGARAQPYEALAAFSRRLSVTPSPEALLSMVADAAGRAVSAQGATASLDASDLPRSSASWGSDHADDVQEHRVLVKEGEVTLGTIEVRIPRGRPFRSSDVRLLTAIADQAAVAFHNMAMEAQLSAHVLALDRTTEELERSRARLVEADAAARAFLAAALSGEVLPHLAAVSDGLNGHAGRWSSQCLDDMVTEVNVALESLRELTHGVFPAQLARSGLEPALRSYVRRARHGSVVEIAPDVLDQRFAPRIEGAVYFAATRALGTGPGHGLVSLGIDDNQLLCSVSGTAQAQTDRQGIMDRVEAVGGSVRLSSDGLELRIPLTAGSAATSVAGGRPRG